MERGDRTEEWFLTDAEDTRALGRALAGRLHGPLGTGRSSPLLLRGDLGAGKTCLVQGLAEGLGIAEPITSPTFALAQHYAGRLMGQATALVHLDLYRLDDPAAADELFAQEEEEAAATDAVLAVEWPDRLSFLPEGAWEVRLEIVGEGRLARVTAGGLRADSSPAPGLPPCGSHGICR